MITSSCESIGRRARNKLEKRKRIGAAARELFHRQGYENTGVGEIAHAAGVAEGTLFLYVTRKEDLLVLALVDELGEAVERAFGALNPEAHLITQTVAFFTSLLAYHERDVALSKLFLREVAVLRDPLRDYGFAQVPMMERLSAIVERGQQRGDIAPNIPVPHVARLCFALYWGTLRDWVNDVLTTEQFAYQLSTFLTLTCDGLRMPGSEV